MPKFLQPGNIEKAQEEFTSLSENILKILGEY